MAKSAAKEKEPKRVVLETRFAGIAAGSILYVATPDIVADYVQKIPSGTTRSIPQMRRDLAKKTRPMQLARSRRRSSCDRSRRSALNRWRKAHRLLT